MTFNIHFDFEAFSEVDLLKAGAWRYAEDASTEILCFAYKINDSKTRAWYPGRNKPLDLILILESGNYVYNAHNAEFETALWLRILHEKLGWPAPIFENIRCTAAKAAALSLPRKLDHVGKALGLPLLKDDAGHRIMMKLCKPRKISKKNSEPRWTVENAFLDFIKLYAYCIRDVDVEKLVDENLRDLSEDELQIYHLDQKINRRGVYLDREAIETALRFIELYSEKLVKELTTITGGLVKTAGQIAMIIQYVGFEGVEMDGLSADAVSEALARDDISKNARRVLEIRQLLGLASIKKLGSMTKMICSDGRARGTLLYHGAGTGRWAGRLLQPQNMTRGTLKAKELERVFELLRIGDYQLFKKEFPDVLKAVSSCLRGMICAAPGNKLIAADFSAIEARVLFWLARCAKGIEAFKNSDEGTGPEPYIVMAIEIYNRPITKKDNPDERSLGKQAILGCGFGMGKVKFLETCLKYKMKVGKKLAEKAVGTYRETFHEVPQFWREIEDAAVRAVRNPGQTFRVGLIAYRRVGRFLFCRLPSGRLISYYKPHFRWAKTSWGEDKLALHYWGVNSKTKHFEPIPTYGGKLVENLVQGTARDLMAAAMIRAEDKGYDLTMTVHDELVAEVLKDFGSVEEFEKIMCVLPDWASGENPCPIGAEGWEGHRFKK